LRNSVIALKSQFPVNIHFDPTLRALKR
jgi:hypothetical protein